MERATIIGIAAGTVLWLAGAWMGTGDLTIYIDIAALLITVGGSFCSIVVSIPGDKFGMIRTALTQSAVKKSWNLEETIKSIVSFAEQARRDGVLSLDRYLDQIEEPFLKKSLRLVIDGTDPETVKRILFHEIDQMESRHARVKKILDDWGYFAPAWGMIGTLTGLVGMLRNMSDVSSIGRNMGTALVTTLYGAVTANLIFLPMAAKLDFMNKQDVLEREVIIEGVLSIQSGDNPVIIREKLESFLEPAHRTTSEKPEISMEQDA